ncbi:MAG: LemA family protein [Candidatus Bathyarchaeota archaeon]
MDLGNALMFGIPIIVLAVVIVYFVSIFNKLYRYRNASDATLNQIGVALQKRLDMIEQLLGAVKGYVKHEREIFEAIAKLRAGLPQSNASELDEVNRESLEIAGNLIAVAEAYPELKANETVIKLMGAIVSVENEIARQRYTYNNVVQEFNTMVDTIPSNFVAQTQGMEKRLYLEFKEEVESRPEVKGITES